jgi:hypothetical protein
VGGYEERRKELVRAKRYHDAAYAVGYQNGLLYLMSGDRTRKYLPMYFVYGSPQELKSIAAFKREAAKAKQLHRQAYAQAERIAKRYGPDLVSHHRPEL